MDTNERNGVYHSGIPHIFLVSCGTRRGGGGKNKEEVVYVFFKHLAVEWRVLAVAQPASCTLTLFDSSVLCGPYEPTR